MEEVAKIYPSRFYIPEAANYAEGEKSIINGVEVSWFIGDGIFDVKLEDGAMGMSGKWHAWGSANGKAYQVHAIYYAPSGQLQNITVLDDKKNHYFDQETYDMLTNGKNSH